MSTYKCQYCKNNFSSKSSLTTHIKRARYCIKIRYNKSKDKQGVFICDDCNRGFTSKQSLNIHKENCLKYNIKLERIKLQRCNEIEIDIYKKQYEECKKNAQIERERYEKRISELEGRLENIAIKADERPTTYQDNRKSNVNQIINNLQPITEEHFKEQAQYLTFDHIKRGVPGYVEYALEYPLKNRVICVDFSRRKIKYKDTDENIITDPEMSKLSQKLFSAIDERNKALILDYLEEMRKRLFGNIDDEKSEEDHLEDDRIVKEVSRICDYKIGVLKGSRGDLTDFQRDFIKGVCTKVSS